MAKQRTNARIQLLMIGGLFIVPIVLGYWFATNWRPDSFVNNGELFRPTLPTGNMQARQLQVGNLPVVPYEYSKKWHLVRFVAGKNCNETCQSELDLMSRIRLTQGKNAYRLVVLSLESGEPSAKAYGPMTERSREIVLAGLQSNYWQQLTTQVQGAFDNPNQWLDYFYLMDPLGNLVMRFPKKMDPSLVKKDLRRLLKVSQIG